MTLTACILTQNHEDWIGTCLESLKGAADRIVVVDGGSTDGTLDIVSRYPNAEVHVHKFTGNMGQQRNNYLRYLKPGDWTLVLDSDEVLSDNGFLLGDSIIPQLSRSAMKVFDLHMEHFIWNFGLVDATKDRHFVPRRLFRYRKGMAYPHAEHAVLGGFGSPVGQIDAVTLFHCGYLNGMPYIRARFDEHKERSSLMSREYLDSWLGNHVRGTYPTRKYDGPYPQALKDRFNL